VLASYPASPIVSFARVLMALMCRPLLPHSLLLDEQSEVLQALSVVLSYGLQSHPSRSCLLSLLSVARAARDARRRRRASSPEAALLPSGGGGVEAGGAALDRREATTSSSAAAAAVGAATAAAAAAAAAAPPPTPSELTFWVVTSLFLACSVGIALVVTDLGLILSAVGLMNELVTSFIEG